MIAVCIIVTATIAGNSATAAPAEAADPGNPANIYIKDVIVASQSDPLNFNSGGMRILLTSQGDSVGIWWDGAMALAYFTIDSWQRQTGKSWPYQWRSRESVAREIQFHCLIFDTTTRRTTISFNGW
ncbi:MAG: hypothetical protein AAB567_00445 [Patescibacteria group bacterium]